MRNQQGYIALNDRRCFIGSTQDDILCTFLPEETEGNDGDAKWNERHAVTDGVTDFNSEEEFSLRGKTKNNIYGNSLQRLCQSTDHSHTVRKITGLDYIMWLIQY